MIDQKGFRLGIGIVLVNERNRVFWARRIRQNAWQFPQGGLLDHETAEEAMYRELYEEVGLKQKDVSIITETQEWLRYRLPRYMVRYHSRPLCIGQKQKWFLLRFQGHEDHVRFDTTETPEFDYFRWVRYWFPLRKVIAFKRGVYRNVLQEFAKQLFPNRASGYQSDDIEE